MISLADFKKYESIKQEIKEFLVEKCKEYDDAKAFCPEDYYQDNDFEEDFNRWKFEGLYLHVYFISLKRDWSYSYLLPIDILFNSDFKDKIKARFEEEREKQRLALLEKRKQREAELTKQAEAKRHEKIEMLKGLMREFPDVVKEGV